MKKSCVIGWPIQHSRSPIIHNYWLNKYNIAGHYGIVPVQPEDLQDFITSMVSAGYAGCNVTIPHKEAAFAFVKYRDERSSRLGAINTIYVSDDELHATNTDGEGFIANIKTDVPQIVLANNSVAVLGAGGSAMAIAGALLDEDVSEILIFNRSIEKSQALRQRFGKTVKPRAWELRNSHISDSALLVNTTSLGMKGQPPLEIDLHALPVKAAVADIVYVPLTTPLLQQARARGHPTTGGLGMLLHQAVKGFELWFGIRPSVTAELYDLVAKDIDPGKAA